MEILSIGKLNFESFTPFVDIREKPIYEYPWTQVDAIALTPVEETQLQFITQKLLEEPSHLLNEATIWARAIYPLLLLGERGAIRARAEVSLSATYQQFQITGIADGALGRTIASRVIAPFLVVVEAKRGIEGSDPIPQLYGEMLAAARLNWQLDQQEPQIIFGCYTIADTWTFLKGEVAQVNGERPVLSVEYSREYTQKYDIVTILKLIKSIVQHYEQFSVMF
jgi:hypothetical protein